MLPSTSYEHVHNEHVHGDADVRLTVQIFDVFLSKICAMLYGKTALDADSTSTTSVHDEHVHGDADVRLNVQKFQKVIPVTYRVRDTLHLHLLYFTFTFTFWPLGR